MSRIGNAIIEVPQGIDINVSKGNIVTVKGPKGELTQAIDPDLKVEIDEGKLVISRPTNQKRHKSAHGLYRSLINNMVEGVKTGYVKELELVGVGYRANSNGNLLEISVGYSHPIYFAIPDEIKLETETVKGMSPLIRLSGIDKQLIGQVAAKIKAFRKPEPYKGKGIRFKGEEIRRKAGKTAG